jgi:hypothetical protein
MLSSVKASRTKDPRPTLAAYGAPLAGFAPRREMPLEEAVVLALVLARRDGTVALVLPLVLLKNAGRLRTRTLRKLARELGVEPELGMMLDLADALRPAPRLASAAKGLRPLTGRPAYYPRLLGGKYEKMLADEKTPPVVARWGFRMNATEGDLRGFVEKHLG